MSVSQTFGFQRHHFQFAFVLPNGLKGAGDARYTVLTTLIGMVLFRLMLGYFLGVTLGYGVVGVWCGIIADWFVRSALYVIRLRGTRWQRQLITIRRTSDRSPRRPEETQNKW